MATQLHINTGSGENVSIGTVGDTLRFAGIKTEKNFNELFPIINEKPLPFPYTGSAQITGSLEIAGSIDTNTISASKFSVFLETVGLDQNNAGIVKVKGSNYIYFNSKSFEEQISVNPGIGGNPRGMVRCFHKNFGSGPDRGRAVIFNSILNNREFIFKGTTENFLLCGNGDNLSVAIKQDSQTVAKDLDVLGSISSSEYYSSNLPTTDPEVAGQWFSQDSQTVFGESGYKVLCISRGPTNFVRDGLKFMHAPGIIGADGTTFISPYLNLDTQNANPDTFKNALQGGRVFGSDGEEPTSNAGENNIFSGKGPNVNYNLYTNTTDYSNPLSYNWFSTYDQYLSITASIFEEKSTLIFWWKGLTDADTSAPPSLAPGFRPYFWMGINDGNGTTFSFQKVKNDTHRDMRLGFGEYSDSYKIPEYFSSSFYDDYGIDITDWHMIALTFEASSGVTPYNLYISQSGGGYKQSGNTASGFNMKVSSNNKYFCIGAGGGTARKSVDYGQGQVFTSSLFMYYSKSLSEQEINDMYGYFSASHGL